VSSDQRRFPGSDQRGIALPMALIGLVLLASLSVAFTVLSQSEPLIAANHARGAQARAMAESGIERAVWALSSGGVPVPAAGAAAAAPYDGSTYVGVNGKGGFTVRITGVSDTQVMVEAVGWHPDPTAPTKARRRVQSRLERFRDVAGEAPCTLCVNGDVTVTGASTIDGRPSYASSCGNKMGSWSTGATSIERSRAKVYGGERGGGSGAANVRNVDFQEHQAGFADFDLTPAELAALRAVARGRGAYYTGTVTFNASNPLPPGGIVFVDTTTGAPVAPGMPDAQLAKVTLTGGARPANAPFRGWLVVNGNLSLAGGFGGIDGVVYVANRVTTTGFGTDTITGLVIAAERRGDADAGFSAGNTNIVYDCDNARGAGQMPRAWFLQAGSYQELPD
jgi:hypothetical protein